MPVKFGSNAYVGAAAFLQIILLAACSPGDVGNRAEAPSQAKAVQPVIVVKGPERLILAFGDSLYAGYGLKAGESMPAQVETLLRRQGINAKVVNAGVSGDTTAAGRKRLAFALDNLSRKPYLVLLGLGWNFGFIGGTSLLTDTYEPEEKNKAQGLNDFLVFATTAITSLSAGKLLAWFGWSGVNYAVFPMVVLALAMIVWLARHPLSSSPAKRERRGPQRSWGR